MRLGNLETYPRYRDKDGSVREPRILPGWAVVMVCLIVVAGLVTWLVGQHVQLIAKTTEMRSLEAEHQELLEEWAEVVYDRAELTDRLEDATSTISARDAEVDLLDSQVASLTAELETKPGEATVRASKPVPAPSGTRTSTTGVEQWRSLVAKHFPASAVDEALYIIGKESGGDPSNGSLKGCYGLFQIDAGTHFHHYPEVDGSTAEGNTYIAYRLWLKSGKSFDEHWYDHTHYARYGS